MHMLATLVSCPRVLLLSCVFAWQYHDLCPRANPMSPTPALPELVPALHACRPRRVSIVVPALWQKKTRTWCRAWMQGQTARDGVQIKCAVSVSRQGFPFPIALVRLSYRPPLTGQFGSKHSLSALPFFPHTAPGSNHTPSCAAVTVRTSLSNEMLVFCGRHSDRALRYLEQSSNIY